MQNDLIKIGFTPKNIHEQVSMDVTERARENIYYFIHYENNTCSTYLENEYKNKEYYIQLLDFLEPIYLENVDKDLRKGIKYTKDTLVSRTFLEELWSDLENWADIYSNHIDFIHEKEQPEAFANLDDAINNCEHIMALIDRALKQ